MHLKEIKICSEEFPTNDFYPFNLDIFKRTKSITFNAPITFFVGENGSGKSTLLRAITEKCNIYIWEGLERTRYVHNPFEKDFYKYLDIEWEKHKVPGSFFASEIFKNFAQNVDEWATTSPGTLDYYGGKSLLTQSHGQCHMSYFKNRYKIEGLYFLDEPENALSPKRQIELIEIITNMSKDGHAQFIIATHSPLLLSCPMAHIYSFDHIPIKHMDYEDTEHYKVYKNFFDERVSS